MKIDKLKNFLSTFNINSKLILESLNYKLLFNDSESDDLRNKKFHIYKNVVNRELIEEIRNFWMDVKVTDSFYSEVSLGSKNYSKCFFGKYTRHFDFYWNKPRHIKTRDLSLTLHAVRNLILDLDPYYGLLFSDKRVGIYQAITHYPLGEGEMTMHIDPNYFLNVHYNLPLTHAGQDYANGGLYVMNNGAKESLDNQMSMGDLLLFDGNLSHGIEKVSGRGLSSGVGRFQLFSIPTMFESQKKTLLGEIAFEVYGRFRYLLYSKGIGIKNNGRNFR